MSTTHSTLSRSNFISFSSALSLTLLLKSSKISTSIFSLYNPCGTLQKIVLFSGSNYLHIFWLCTSTRSGSSCRSVARRIRKISGLSCKFISCYVFGNFFVAVSVLPIETARYIISVKFYPVLVHKDMMYILDPANTLITRWKI